MIGHMLSMPLSVLKCMLFFTMMHGALCVCMPNNHTLWIERRDCAQCVAINTTICNGYCFTRDTNLRGRFGRTFLIQRSCVPLSLVYRAAHLPGCPQDVNPQLYYPAAHRCSCRRCDSRTHHCVRTSRISNDRCTLTPDGARNQTQRVVGESLFDDDAVVVHPSSSAPHAAFSSLLGKVLGYNETQPDMN